MVEWCKGSGQTRQRARTCWHSHGGRQAGSQAWTWLGRGMGITCCYAVTGRGAGCHLTLKRHDVVCCVVTAAYLHRPGSQAAGGAGPDSGGEPPQGAPLPFAGSCAYVCAVTGAPLSQGGWI